MPAIRGLRDRDFVRFPARKHIFRFIFNRRLATASYCNHKIIGKQQSLLKKIQKISFQLQSNVKEYHCIVSRIGEFFQ